MALTIAVVVFGSFVNYVYAEIGDSPQISIVPYTYTEGKSESVKQSVICSDTEDGVIPEANIDIRDTATGQPFATTNSSDPAGTTYNLTAICWDSDANYSYENFSITLAADGSSSGSSGSDSSGSGSSGDGSSGGKVNGGASDPSGSSGGAAGGDGSNPSSSSGGAVGDGSSASGGDSSGSGSSGGAGGLVPCSGTDCTTCDVISLGNNVVQWLIGILFVIFALLAAYAGFELVTSGGNPAAKTSAKKKLTNAIIGFIIVLAAWLIVDTFMRTLLSGTGGKINGKFWYEIECASQAKAEDTGSEAVPTPEGVDCSDESALMEKYNGSPKGAVNSQLLELISCYRGDAAIEAALDTSQIYTVDRSHPICALTNGNPVCGACSHGVNSCHYGRGSGNGAMAVDFNANNSVTEEDLYNLIKKRQPVCGGRLLFEGNHTHISLDSC